MNRAHTFSLVCQIFSQVLKSRHWEDQRRVQIISRIFKLEYWQIFWYWVDAQDHKVMGYYSDPRSDHYSGLHWSLKFLSKFWCIHFFSFLVMCWKDPSFSYIHCKKKLEPCGFHQCYIELEDSSIKLLIITAPKLG